MSTNFAYITLSTIFTYITRYYHEYHFYLLVRVLIGQSQVTCSTILRCWN
jgi:hypothetical protein